MREGSHISCRFMVVSHIQTWVSTLVCWQVAQGLSNLTPEQQAVVSSLRNPGRELRELAAAYSERCRKGEDVLQRPSRLRAVLRKVGEGATRRV